MSLLEWSPETNSIVTVSIHYYERDEFKVTSDSRQPFLILTLVTERVPDQPISVQHPH